MSYTDKPSGMEGDTVPAVQYPADEEKKHQQRSSTSNVQSASAHLATPAPALPPRHSAGLADSQDYHHAHHDHEAGHHHTHEGSHETEHRRHHHGITDTAGATSSSFSNEASTRGVVGGEIGHQSHEALKSAYHVLHGGMEMLRGALLGLGDTAGDAMASRSHNPRLTQADTESDQEIIARGKAELEKGLSAFKS